MTKTTGTTQRGLARRTRPSLRRVVGVLATVGLSGGLVAGTSGAAFGASASHRPGPLGGSGGPAVAGSVATAPSGDSFTITTRSGSTETIDVAVGTTYIERGTSSPSLSNVAVGDLVAVFGSTSGTTVSATEVIISPPRPSNPGQPVSAGKVASAPSGNSFTITTRSGSTETVDVSASTVYLERKIASPTLSNVAVGDLVGVFGSLSGSTITATQVVIRPAGPRNFVTAGTVETAPSANTFTLKSWSGTLETVDVTSSTLYAERGVSSPSLTNVSVGDLVTVFGTASGTTVSATEVAIAMPPPVTGNFATAGTVDSAPAGDAFTVKTWNGTLETVNVTASTTYAEYGVTAPTLNNVSVGEFVGVFGTTTGTTVTATQVVIAGSEGHGLFGYGKPFHFARHGFGGFGGFGFGR